MPEAPEQGQQAGDPFSFQGHWRQYTTAFHRPQWGWSPPLLVYKEGLPSGPAPFCKKWPRSTRLGEKKKERKEECVWGWGDCGGSIYLLNLNFYL